MANHEMDDEVARLRRENENLQEALVHWQRKANEDALELVKQRERIAELEGRLAHWRKT